MSEISTLRQIMSRLSNGVVRLFRNNNGRLQDHQGQWVQYGLCPGTSDLIGWKSVVITSGMVGKTVAIFVALEVKSKNGKASREQQAFLTTARAAGAIAEAVRSVEEAERALLFPSLYRKHLNHFGGEDTVP